MEIENTQRVNSGSWGGYIQLPWQKWRFSTNCNDANLSNLMGHWPSLHTSLIVSA